MIDPRGSQQLGNEALHRRQSLGRCRLVDCNLAARADLSSEIDGHPNEFAVIELQAD